MNETTQKNIEFIDIYNKSYRLAAAVFMISNLMDEGEEIKTRIKNLSLNLVSVSVNLKDTTFSDSRKMIGDLEKNSLELMSMLDIAAVSGLISKMNGGILKDEFQSFVTELGKFAQRFEEDRNVSVKGVFGTSLVESLPAGLPERNVPAPLSDAVAPALRSESKVGVVAAKNIQTNGNGHKRKDFRRNTVLEFIKGHNNVSIKDIVPNISGCSEKTIQRELVSLIKEGKIKKAGERRWSKYSVS